MPDTSEIFKSLAVDARRDLLLAMVETDQTVQELTAVVSISQSAVSQHLAKIVLRTPQSLLSVITQKHFCVISSSIHSKMPTKSPGFDV